MLKPSDILDEKNPKLHKKSEEVTFPLSDKDKKLIKDAIKYLELSQDEEYASKNNMRAGMGLAFVQLGILKRIFVISLLEEDDTFTEYVVINPKIISRSAEEIYVEEGEGCLSVNREAPGVVLRHARVTVEYFDINGNKQTTRVREDMAVAFQHEIDHLNGILFVDKIDKNNPFKDKNKYRSI